jgi:hypothetical protein
MTTIKRALGIAFLCLVPLVGSGFAATPTTELLYVQQGQNVVTTSVNTKTAVTKKLGTLNTAYSGAQPIINRSGNFLYMVGFTPALEYFTVFSLTAAGVPNPKAIQTLNVKPSLHQFVIHPNGLKLVSTLEAEVVHFIAEIAGVLRALPQGPQPVVGILDLDTVDELNV